jgi:16S rRNA (cytidine1402-2'-O)-methyltransferase
MISDPGQSLIQQAQEQGIPVHVLPGACAAITALVRSGQSAYHFTFAGFLPPKTTPRRKALQSFVQAPGSLIFYESPHRIAASLKDMAAILQDRPATVARELTKRFEEITHGSLVELADLYASKPSPKGEIVVIVGENNDSNGQGDISDQSHIDALLREALGRARLKEAVKEVSVITGAPRNEIYARALLLSQGGSKD